VSHTELLEVQFFFLPLIGTRNLAPSPPCWARINGTNLTPKKSCLTGCWNKLQNPRVQDRLTRLPKRHQPETSLGSDPVPPTPLSPHQQTPRTARARVDGRDASVHHAATAKPSPPARRRASRSWGNCSAAQATKTWCSGTQTGQGQRAERLLAHQGAAPSRVQPLRQPRRSSARKHRCISHARFPVGTYSYPPSFQTSPAQILTPAT